MNVNLIEWFSGAPLVWTTAIVAAMSGVLTSVAWASSRRREIRWPVALTGPFVVASCVYWSPTLAGQESSEHAHWAVLFVGIWGTAGVGISILITLVWTIVSRHRAR